MAAGEPAAELPQRLAHPLVDPDAILRGKIVEFVSRGDFGLASGRKPDGSYERVWFDELVAPDEVAFDAGCSC